MRIIEYKYPEPTVDLPASLVCLGFFDGVHIGHRTLIVDAVKRARGSGLLAVVFTFPAESESLKSGAARIYPTEKKLAIFESLGVDAVVLCDFASVASLSPESFVREVLVGSLGARVALAGADFRFGHRASGNSDMLRELMRLEGGDAVIHEMEYIDVPGGRVEVSASLIREYLSSGRPELAAELLGEPYTVSGITVHGDGRGGKNGYPTVNTELPDGSVLLRGVYHTEVRVGGKAYVGLSNVGTCPTFGERREHIETYVLDFDEDVYGECVEIAFLGYLREERRFESATELALEIEKNIKEAVRRSKGGKREDN